MILEEMIKEKKERITLLLFAKEGIHHEIDTYFGLLISGERIDLKELENSVVISE